MDLRVKIQFRYILSIIMCLVACDGGKMTEKLTFDDFKGVPASSWKALSEKKIYFGHQSVGFNIMDGVADLMKEFPDIKLNIVETKETSKFKKGIFAHSRVGKNGDSISKIDEFKEIIEDGLGESADVAALKFCYVDIRSDTNIEKVFNNYVESIDLMKNKYPNLDIVHFTEPLTVTRVTWKTLIKKLMGKKDIWEYTENIKRNQYNELLIERYKNKEPILDIAALQSTYLDGKRSTFKVSGKTYYSMAREYTHDGGHLNEIGRKRVAKELLLLLANLP